MIIIKKKTFVHHSCSFVMHLFFRTALHLACSQGNEDIIKFLLTNNAKTNLCDNTGRTPLMKVLFGTSGKHWKGSLFILNFNSEPFITSS